MCIAITATLAPPAVLADDKFVDEIYCLGFDGSFVTEIAGFHDFWLVSESGCPQPGMHWLLQDCATGQGIATFVGDGLAGSEGSLGARFTALRNRYAANSSGLTLSKIEADLKSIGAHPDPGRTMFGKERLATFCEQQRQNIGVNQ